VTHLEERSIRAEGVNLATALGCVAALPSVVEYTDSIAVHRLYLPSRLPVTNPHAFLSILLAYRKLETSEGWQTDSLI